MCGIAGILHRDPTRPVHRSVLTCLAAIQHHRGPDGYGVFCMDDRGVGFSHARLGIIDLDQQRARQPFLSVDENFLITHNGEFYDYQRLRADLTCRGAHFLTKSDSELPLHLLPRMGLEKTLERLRGEFAFAVYDKPHDRLILVRDRFGIKPLYWTQTPDSLIFGSEIKVLFSHPEVRRVFSPKGLYHQLMQTMVPGTTAFEGIHQVPPGHYVTIERRNYAFQINQHKYWDMNFPTLDNTLKISEQEATEQVRALLLQAVQLRLEADVPVACYLSGGIDSCSILGLASACRQSPVKAFTISFDDRDYDESPIAREMAKRTGAEQDILEINASHLYDNFSQTIWHTERTIYNTLAVAKFLMSRHVHQSGYKVVVTGEGADELFAGYPAFRRDLFLHGQPDVDPAHRLAHAQNLQEQNRIFQGAMLAENEIDDPGLSEVVGFTPACLQPWLATSRYVPNLLSRQFRDELRGYDPGRAIASALDADMLENRSALDKAQYVWIKTMLEGQILTWGGDRVDMANSMESRPAFLDHHLAEFAVRIPQEYRIHQGREKHVLREAMRGLLPQVLYDRQKFAFMAPPAFTDISKQKALAKLIKTHLSPQEIHRAGWLDSQGVENVLQQYRHTDTSPATRRSLDAIINHVLGVQLLHQHFIDTDVPKLARERAEVLGWT